MAKTITLFKRLQSFLALKTNWDSYGAPPISPQAVWRAQELIEEMQAVPTVNGGVQLECHMSQQSIEIEMDSDGRITSVAVFDEPSGFCRELKDSE